MKNLIKFFKNFILKLNKNKLVKSLVGLFTVLMSYRIIKLIWYFNKLIIYLLGLIFVGFNWSDLKIFNDLKLGYDSFKLYILNWFNPNNDYVKNKIIKTETDIKDLIRKENDSSDKKIFNDNNYKKVLIEKVIDEKSLFKSLREKYLDTENVTISDSKGNEYTIKSILSDPKIIIILISLVIISGAIVISIYDINLDQITHFPLNVARMTWTGISLLFWKIVNIFRSNGGGNLPPINPNNNNNNDNPEPDIEIQDTRIFNSMKSRFDNLFADSSSKIWKERKDEIITLRNEIKELNESDPLNPLILEKRSQLSDIIRLTNIKELNTATKFEDSPIDNSSSGSITPKASGSNIQLPSNETNAFAEIADNREFRKGKSSLTTPQQQADYFNKTTSMKDDSILLSDDLLDKFN